MLCTTTGREQGKVGTGCQEGKFKVIAKENLEVPIRDRQKGIGIQMKEIQSRCKVLQARTNTRLRGLRSN